MTTYLLSALGILSVLVLLPASVAAVQMALDMSEGYVEYSLKCLSSTYRTLIFAGSDNLGDVNTYVYANVKATRRFDETRGIVVYVNPCAKCDPKKQIDDICVRVGILGQEDVAISVLKQYFGGDQAANIAYLRKMVATVKGYIERGECFSKLLVYTDQWNWKQVVGAWEDLAGDALLWWKSPDNNPAVTNFMPFGGWKKEKIAYKMFKSVESVCDISDAGQSSYAW